jgi:hypothetical protein
VHFGAAGARWRGVGGQVDAAVSAEVVAAGESFSTDEIVGALCAPGLRLFGFNIWFSSPTRGREREPSGGGVHPGTIAAAAEVAGESPGVVVPQALRCGGCSYLREWNWSSVCNGILSAGVYSLWLSGPEHLGILGAISCFFLISSTMTRLSASWTA